MTDDAGNRNNVLNVISQPELAAATDIHSSKRIHIHLPHTEQAADTDVPQLEAHLHSPTLLPQPLSQSGITKIITKLEWDSLQQRTLSNASVYNTDLAPNSKVVPSNGVSDAAEHRWERWIASKMLEVCVLWVAEGVVIIYYEFTFQIPNFFRAGLRSKQLRSSTRRMLEPKIFQGSCDC